MPVTLALAVLALVGLTMVGAGMIVLRQLGADVRLGRRLAGARELTVAEALRLTALPSRPVRLAGRVRCADPLAGPDGEALVAFHRDVEVRLPVSGWRTIERARLSRSFELWDAGGSLPVDQTRVAEPLITIPRIWEGPASELSGRLAAAIARLAAQGGIPDRGRSVTREIGTVDHVIVLAQLVRGHDGSIGLAAPPGGYVISAVDLPDAMRLLGGRRRGPLVAGIVVIAAGAALAVMGMAGALVGLFLER